MYEKIVPLTKLVAECKTKFSLESLAIELWILVELFLSLLITESKLLYLVWHFNRLEYEVFIAKHEEKNCLGKFKKNLELVILCNQIIHVIVNKHEYNINLSINKNLIQKVN